jgi:hypothetical protein
MPKKQKKTKKSKASKSKATKSKAINSNVNKINININTGKGKGTGTTKQSRKKGNKDTVTGVSTGGLNGPDNKVGAGLSHQPSTTSYKPEAINYDSLASKITGLLGNSREYNSALLNNKPPPLPTQSLLEDRLYKIERLTNDLSEDTDHNKYLLDEGHRKLNNYFSKKSPLIEDIDDDVNIEIEDVGPPVKTVEAIDETSEPTTVPVNQNEKIVTKGKGKYRFTIDKKGNLKTEKYQHRTNTYTLSSKSSMIKETKVKQSELDQIKQQLKGGAPTEPKEPKQKKEDKEEEALIPQDEKMATSPTVEPFETIDKVYPENKNNTGIVKMQNNDFRKALKEKQAKKDLFNSSPPKLQPSSALLDSKLTTPKAKKIRVAGSPQFNPIFLNDIQFSDDDAHLSVDNDNDNDNDDDDYGYFTPNF